MSAAHCEQTSTVEGVSVEVMLSPQTRGVIVPGPGCVLRVTAAASSAVDKIEVRYRGIEVVGGTVDDSVDEFDGQPARKGVRVLTKAYFDERVVVWDGAQGATMEWGTEQTIGFSIGMPRANYPAEIRSTLGPESQHFEICYQLVALAFNGDSVVARHVHRVPFTPSLSKTIVDVPQPAVSRTAYDDRGNECLVTRVTLSQPEYVPGDQVLGGVFIEMHSKANNGRTVRKAECQLRQRIECRMRRSGNETIGASGMMRPQSAPGDESDILWTRVVDLEPPQTLTLTSYGVGLAAMAEGAENKHDMHGGEGYGSGAGTGGGGGADDQRRGGSSLMAGYKACSANIHTVMPINTPVIAGHFLAFTYELLITATVAGLAWGMQKVSTRTAIGGLAEAGSPTCESAPAGAFGTVDSSVSLKSMDDPNRFSVDAFRQGKASRFSMMTVNTVAARDVGVMPNAVEIMRSRTEDPVKPRLFLDDQADSEILGEPDSARHSVVAEEDGEAMADSARQSKSTDVLSAVGNHHRSTMRQGVEVPLIVDPSVLLADGVAVQASQNAKTEEEEEEQTKEEEDEEEEEEEETPADGTPVSDRAPSFDFSVGSDEFGFASAVYAAAQKVLRAKDWEGSGTSETASPTTAQTFSDSGAEANDIGGLHRQSVLTPMLDLSGTASSTQLHEPLDIASAIDDLAPVERRHSASSSKGSMDSSSKAQQFIGSMEFFDSSPGPELTTGMLAGDPNKLINALNFDIPEPAVSETPQLVTKRSLTDRSLRRSMSMPDTSADSLSARRRFDTEPAIRSQQLVAGRMAHMSPRSVISAVSSVSRFGGSKGAGGSSSGSGGVLRSISHRLTSWFTKKN
ncbi:hypothetical protein FBU59_000141 [Linderina macrospora]|uniref:Uncharacterized protein n=1 Tax=Linderina macrospora TaxID=4868 RepID=A0ACC1JHP5_9FUNG|nr:hypothetical protein FBU59_000141 [Linderina macrospora]